MKTKQVISALGALAQETRLALFRLLVQKGPEGMPAGEIGDALGVPASSLSFHLTQLQHAGLITQRRRSRSLIYSADYDATNLLMQFLTENCCGTKDECAPVCAPGSAPARANGGSQAARRRSARIKA